MALCTWNRSSNVNSVLDSSERVWSSEMNQLQILRVFIACTCLAVSLGARSQDVPANARGNVSSTAATGQVVPSDAIQPSGMLALGDKAATNTGRRKTANIGTRSGSARADSVPRRTSELCFQPGIGWESVTIIAPMSTKMLSALGSSNGGASDGMETNKAATSVRSQSNRGPSSGVAINSGSLRWRNTKSVADPASSKAIIPDDEIAGLKAKAHLNPMKLRRMMWSAPDLQTRIELRKLQETLTKPTSIETGVSKRFKATAGRVTNEPRSNAGVSSRPVRHRRATDGSRRPSYRAHP
jgi:hypothetical protein